MNRITHKYIVSIRLLEKLEKFVKENENVTVQELVTEFRKLKILYRCGLANLEER